MRIPGKFLAIDGGNSRLKVTLFPIDGSAPEVRVFPGEKSDDLLAYIEESRAEMGAMAYVGHVDSRLLETLRRVLNDKFLLITSSTPLPINISYPQPETLGIDRKATAVAAAAEYPGERCLVIDAGSAVTCDLVTDEGFVKGSISPGLAMRFRALNAFTAQLPEVAVPGNSVILPVLANSTDGAILSGVTLGFLNEVLADILTLGVELNGVQRVIVTGGDASLICSRLYDMPMLPSQRKALDEISIVHDPHLLSKGVRAIYLHHENEF